MDLRDPQSRSTKDSAAHIGQIEVRLGHWLPDSTFIKAAPIDAYPVLSEEWELVTRAVSRRQREFATGRWLARQGLRSFGLADQAIGMGKLKNPIWPTEVLGTISHDGEWCIVAVHRRGARSPKGLGVDLVSLERVRPMDDLAGMFMADPHELDAVATLNVPIDPALLLFSIKESAIKALSFRLADFIDMRAIELRREQSFMIHLDGTAIYADVFADRVGDYLVTAVKVP